MSALTLQTVPVQGISWGRRLFPLVAVQGYLWTTFALFVFGPWNWELADAPKLIGFVCACHLAFALGYLLVAHRRPRETKYRAKACHLLVVSIFVTLLVLPITNYAKTGTFVPDVAGGLADPGEAYLQVHRLTEGSTNLAAYLRILVSPILVLLMPLTVFFWASISRLHKSLAIVAIAGIMALTVASGQRKDIADLLITLPLLGLASHWANVTVFSKRTRATLLIVVLAGSATFLGYFAYSHISRVGESTAFFAANPATGQLPDKDSAIVSVVPEDVQPGAFAFMNYVTTGYYGLSLSLEREWKPMYGVGHSMFLTRNAERFMQGASVESRSLPVQISEKDGFRYPVLWCTAYPYFINDLGTYGVVVLMLALGALFATSWIDTIGRQEPIALAVFWLLAVLVFYLPATNRVLQDGEGVVSFYVLVGMYLFMRRRVTA